MLIITLILAGPQGINEDLGHLINRDHAAVLHKEAADLSTVAIQNQTRQLNLVNGLQIVLGGALTVGQAVVKKVAIHQQAADAA